MPTTTALISFLQAREAFRAKAYDDKQPHLDLEAGDEDKVKGTITIGYGTVRYPNGKLVQLGDEINHSQALDYLTRYVREEVDPVVENLIHRELTDEQYDALGSVVYNFGADEVSSWRLWGRINRDEPGEAIATEWMDGTWTSEGEPMEGLYKRRLMEVLWFFGLDWRMGAATSFGTSVMSLLARAGWDGSTPKPGPAHTPSEDDLFDEAYDPTPETPLTTDDLNIRQRWRLQGAIGTKEISINTKLAAEVPYGIADPKEVGLQPKEESRRYQGAVQKEKGAEMENIGRNLAIASGATGAAVTLSDNLSDLFATLGQVGLTILALAAFVGVVYWVTGKWRKRRGENLEAQGEIDAVQGMY